MTWKPAKPDLEIRDEFFMAIPLPGNVLTKRPKELPDAGKPIVFVENGNVVWVEGAIVYMTGDTKKADHPITFKGCEILQHD